MIKRAFWSRDRLVEFQNKELRKVVQHAYDFVPFYHKKFKDVGLRPQDIRTMKDLNKLPIITKEELRENLDKLISSKCISKNLKVIHTSGSTGEPLFLKISRKEDEYRKAKHIRANMSVGHGSRDRWVTILSPGDRQAPKLLGLLRLYSPTLISVFDDVNLQILKLEKFNHRYLRDTQAHFSCWPKLSKKEETTL